MKINRILSGTFSTENLYKIINWIYSTFWTCDFALKTNTNRSIENQLIFVSSIFVLKINTNLSLIQTLTCIRICRSKTFFYWFCYIFEIAILYWKSMKIFLLKINWFSSFKNFRISLYFLYRDFQIHFSNDFAILLKLPFLSIENQLICQL